MPSSDSSTVIAHLYKSRQVLLELMQAQGYATDDYDGFSINEVSCMHKSQQMDMLLVEDTDKAIKKKDVHQILLRFTPNQTSGLAKHDR